MPEKPPKEPVNYGKVIDFKTRKVIPDPQETLQPKPPEITTEEAKKIFQDIYDNFEPKVWHLHGLVKKAREKFDAYEHLVTSNEYSEGHFRAFAIQQKPHRMGSKVDQGEGITRIFGEGDAQLYGKILENEREFKDYLVNFLRDRENLNDELRDTYAHLKNAKGAEDLKDKLEKYLEKIDFDFASFVFIKDSLEGYREKIKMMEKFSEKMIN